MSDITSEAPQGGADYQEAPRRRSLLKLGGVTLLAGGAVASNAAFRQVSMAEAAAPETANTADSSLPPDARSLVPIPPKRISSTIA